MLSRIMNWLRRWMGKRLQPQLASPATVLSRLAVCYRCPHYRMKDDECGLTKPPREPLILVVHDPDATCPAAKWPGQ